MKVQNVAQVPLPKRQTADSELPNPARATQKGLLIQSTTFENVPLMGKNDQLALTATEKTTGEQIQPTKKRNCQGLNLIIDGQLLDV